MARQTGETLPPQEVVQRDVLNGWLKWYSMRFDCEVILEIARPGLHFTVVYQASEKTEKRRTLSWKQDGVRVID